MWAWIWVASAFAGDWSAGAGATIAAGNAASTSATAFVAGSEVIGRHSLAPRLDGALATAVTDRNDNGTTADDTGLDVVRQDLGVGLLYSMQLGRPREEGERPAPALLIAAETEHRPPAGIFLRPSTTFGLRVHGAKNPEVNSFFDVGILVANEIYTTAAADAAGEKRNSVLGGFVGHSAVWPVGLATWSHRVGVVQNVLDTEDLRIDATGSFDVPVTAHVAVRLMSGLRYDAKPVSELYSPVDISSGVQFVLRAKPRP